MLRALAPRQRRALREALERVETEDDRERPLGWGDSREPHEEPPLQAALVPLDPAIVSAQVTNEERVRRWDREDGAEQRKKDKHAVAMADAERRAKRDKRKRKQRKKHAKVARTHAKAELRSALREVRALCLEAQRLETQDYGPEPLGPIPTSTKGLLRAVVGLFAPSPSVHLRMNHRDRERAFELRT